VPSTLLSVLWVSVTVEEVKAVPPAQELPSQLKMRVAVSSVPSKART